MSYPRGILIGIILIIIVTITGTVLVSKKHARDMKAKTEIKDDFLKIPDYSTEVPKSTSTSKLAPTITTTTTTSYGNGESYWFVVVQRDNGTMMNTLLKQDHNWFSFSEAKASFKGSKVFILNIVKLDKETYDNNQ